MSQQYFLEQTKINNKTINWISIKTPDNQILFGLSIELNHIHHKLLKCSDSLSISRDSDIEFSMNEIECIYWLTDGKSATEISTITNRPRKTIEWYISQIKKKLNCRRTSKLAYLLGCYHAHLITKIQ